MSKLNRIIARDIPDVFSREFGEGLLKQGNFVGLLEYYRKIDSAIPSPTDIEYRFAPSIITRSECEVLGLPSPRFAIRTQGLDSIGFVNLRRIEITKKTLDAPGKDDIAKMVSCCIADCLLIPPDQLDNDYHILKTNLWEVYGEKDNGKNAFPYVKYTQMGGGLCSQACCFMATALLHQYSQGIYAIPEITMIALVTDFKPEFLSFHGLTIRQMQKFFRDPRVGLNAVDEVLLVADGVGDDLAKKRISFVIRSYILSGVPVFQIMDNSLLCRANYSEPGDDYTTPFNARHCLIINGVKKLDRDKFIVADPSTLFSHPFVERTIDEIWCSRIFVKKDKFLAFLPVLPVNMNVSLLPYQHHIDSKENPLRNFSLIDDEIILNGVELDNCELRLVKLDTEHGIVTLEGADTSILSQDNIKHKLENWAVDNKDLCDKWFWILFQKNPENKQINQASIYDTAIDFDPNEEGKLFIDRIIF